MTNLPPPLVIFDLDGTLLHTGPDLVASLNHAIADAGLDPLELADLDHLVGQGGLAMIGRAVKLRGHTLDEEQTRRLQARINDERKIWKLSRLDLDSYSRWYDYSRARDDMFEASDTDVSPWHVAQSDDKKRVRLNIIRHLLASIPYESVPRPKVKLPKRQKPGDYREPDRPVRQVPELY